MEIIQNEYVIMGAGWALFIISELIGASKLKSSGLLELVVGVLKMIAGKK